MLESTRFQNPRIHVIFKVPVVERYPDAIETQTSKEFGIVFREEVLQELVKEEFLLLFPQYFQHGRSVLTFMSGVARNKILHAARELELGPLTPGIVPYFIHPPRPAPLNITESPFPSTTLSPSTRKKPLDMLGRINAKCLERGESGDSI